MNFDDFNLSKETMKSIAEIGFEEPTPIQVSAIPLIMAGHDIVGQAQTGTGKTAAFGIPIVENCHKGKNPFAIILEPTRELAVQVAQELLMIGKFKKISVLPIYGGTSIERQIKILQRGVNVIVGTPGRVMDHMQRRTISLSDIKIVVLDEADEMLDMGFVEDMEKIIKATPSERQTLLFSATIPQPIMNIAKRYMRNPEKIRVNANDIVIPKIKQIFYEVREADKVNALSRLLDVEDPQLAIVFCHTKRSVDEVSTKLEQMGYNAGALHGDFTQASRDEVMNKFKTGMLDILVATDVAARGLDIKDVTHVINYSIPQNPDSYVHRIGRTGRAGKSGIAITFVTPREYNHLRLIEKTAKTSIGRKKLPSQNEVIAAKKKNILKDLSGVIQENKHAEYLSMVKDFSDHYDSGDIAAAALYSLYGETKYTETKERPLEEREEGTGPVRLFMTVGRKDNIKTGDIVKSIVSEAGIPFKKIGKINVFDKFTFVEVPREYSDRIIRSLNDVMMKGRRIKVQQAKPANTMGF
jgi:ATP-dependent RNA helicase DeaD